MSEYYRIQKDVHTLLERKGFETWENDVEIRAGAKRGSLRWIGAALYDEGNALFARVIGKGVPKEEHELFGLAGTYDATFGKYERSMGMADNYGNDLRDARRQLHNYFSSVGTRIDERAGYQIFLAPRKVASLTQVPVIDKDHSETMDSILSGLVARALLP